MSIALNDFIGIYHEVLNGNDPGTAAARAPQYKRYLDWLKTCDMGEAKAHWLSCSGGNVARSVIRAPQGTGDHLTVLQAELNPQQLKGIRVLSDRHGVTLSELLQCAWSVFLALLSRSGSAGYVLTMSGRSAPVAGIESIVGQLSTALPVDIHVSMHETLADVISKVKK